MYTYMCMIYVCCQMCFICRYLVSTVSRVVRRTSLEILNEFTLRVFLRDGAKFRGRAARLSKIPLRRIATSSSYRVLLSHPLDHPLAASADAEWHLDARIKLRSICLRHTAVSNLFTTYVCPRVAVYTGCKNTRNIKYKIRFNVRTWHKFRETLRIFPSEKGNGKCFHVAKVFTPKSVNWWNDNAAGISHSVSVCMRLRI